MIHLVYTTYIHTYIYYTNPTYLPTWSRRKFVVRSVNRQRSDDVIPLRLHMYICTYIRMPLPYCQVLNPLTTCNQLSSRSVQRYRSLIVPNQKFAKNILREIMQASSNFRSLIPSQELWFGKFARKFIFPFFFLFVPTKDRYFMSREREK